MRDAAAGAKRSSSGEAVVSGAPATAGEERRQSSSSRYVSWRSADFHGACGCMTRAACASAGSAPRVSIVNSINDVGSAAGAAPAASAGSAPPRVSIEGWSASLSPAPTLRLTRRKRESPLPGCSSCNRIHTTLGQQRTRSLLWRHLAKARSRVRAKPLATPKKHPNTWCAPSRPMRSTRCLRVPTTSSGRRGRRP
jgi:hypothetical protein